jgi:hypothetical protein
MDEEKFRKFLIRAKTSIFAATNVEERMFPPTEGNSFPDGSKSLVLTYNEDHLSYVVTYFGLNPFWQYDVVEANGEIVWIISCHGSLTIAPKHDSYLEQAYYCIREALAYPTDHPDCRHYHPSRGPGMHHIPGTHLWYYNGCEGDLGSFKGIEWLESFDNEVVYKANYHGGFIKR